MPDFSFFKEFNIFKITIGGNNKTEIGNNSTNGSFYDSLRITGKHKKFKNNTKKSLNKSQVKLLR